MYTNDAATQVEQSASFHGASWNPALAGAGKNGSDDFDIVVFDSDSSIRTIRLNQFGKNEVYFGRSSANPHSMDINFQSAFVSRNHHGVFRKINGCWQAEDLGSTNGLEFNGVMEKAHLLHDGDMLRIADRNHQDERGILMLFLAPGSVKNWRQAPLGNQPVVIGRSENCQVRLAHVSVSRKHAVIERVGKDYVITDCHSSNGLYINGNRVQRAVLREKDVITITTTRAIYTGGYLYYCSYNSGISVNVNNVVIKRRHGRKKFITGDHISLHINPGELVSIIGGSGAGKSTILNCMCGYLQPAEGMVQINGVDLYKNFDSLKKLIGYVPQSDIVFDNLSLYDMLLYTAKLRLPADISKEEREKSINRAISMVELDEKRDSLIKTMSGGQRKRASIAVELLSDPNLLFLDEPASGLDPGTERSLMRTLRAMADHGKTVILVTHSTLQLSLCDKIVFMGKHGKLCYCGPLPQALAFFKVGGIVECYDKMNNEAPQWQQLYNQQFLRQQNTQLVSETPARPKRQKGQLWVLTQRYMKLTLNDKSRLLLLMALVPVAIILISLVKDGTEFHQEDGLNITRNLMFVLSCCCFFLGMFGSISEISKERVIIRREYMTGLSLTMYILSKILVLGLICLVQSLLLVLLFSLLVGTPSPAHRLIFSPLAEMFISVFLLELASTATGLLVSSLVSKPDLGVTITVVLLMPQILFSGLTFTLQGMTEIISWFTVCRWGMEGLGATCDLNAMKYELEIPGMPPRFETNPDPMFDPTAAHLWKVWAILAAFVLVCLLLSRVSMSRVNKE